ncbi:MAG: TolC family protein [Mangrovibacterium sp.]|jgi:outer membrane protein
MKLKLYMTVIAVYLAIMVQAQQEWDLQKCINYALGNNIRIRQQQTNTDYYGNELKQSKNNRLPSLNGSLGNSFSFGKSLQGDNTYADMNSNTTSGRFSANVTLWNNLSIRKSIDMADFNLKASLEDLQKAKDDIVLNVAAAYLQILFAQELVQVAEDQLGVTNLQIERTKKLVNAGSLAKGSLLEIEAQYAQEELNLVNQQNELQLSYLNLYQLLELPVSDQFKIIKPDLPVVTANRTLLNSVEVFSNAVQTRPEVKSAAFKLESYREQVEIAKSALYPTLTLGFDYSNYYNNKYRFAGTVVDGTLIPGSKIPFDTQLKGNDQYGVGFNLSIPVFNKFQTRTQVKNAELQAMNQELELQNTKNVLRTEIEQAYTNALAALKKYIASNKAVESMQEAFRYTEEKFNVGMVNSVEYNQAKNNLTKASSDLAQAKYDYIFRSKILDFYNGVPIEL